MRKYIVVLILGLVCCNAYCAKTKKSAPSGSMFINKFTNEEMHDVIDNTTNLPDDVHSVCSQWWDEGALGYAFGRANSEQTATRIKDLNKFLDKYEKQIKKVEKICVKDVSKAYMATFPKKSQQQLYKELEIFVYNLLQKQTEIGGDVNGPGVLCSADGKCSFLSARAADEAILPDACSMNDPNCKADGLLSMATPESGEVCSADGECSLSVRAIAELAPAACSMNDPNCKADGLVSMAAPE